MLTCIDDIVQNGLCIGCCACVQACTLGPLDVSQGPLGFPVPHAPEHCMRCGCCLAHCPGYDLLMKDDDA